MKNYDIIIKTIDDFYRQFYAVIEEYFENIMNAPSTINRIIRYYALGFVDGVYDSRYILFQDIIIREYKIEVPTMESVINDMSKL